MSDPSLVMVIDDDEALRESVCEVLEDDGYTAIGMPSGASALEHLKSDPEKPGLILLDLMMPGMTGWDFRDEQLHDDLLSPIPTVVMTASRELNGISASEVVYKPLTREKLLSVVHRYAGRPHEPPPPLPPPLQEERGVVVFGLSPRLHLNAAYRRFLEIAAGQVALAGTQSALHEAQRRVEALAELDRAKTAFFSKLSQDFRTPVSSMLGPVQDLLAGVHGELRAEQRAQLELLHRHALELEALVDALSTEAEPFREEALRWFPREAERARLRDEGGQREELYSMFMQAPVPICVLRGEDLVFELANPIFEQVTGRKAAHRTLLEAFPEVRGQGFDQLLRAVMTSGKPHVGREVVVRLDRDQDGVPEESSFNFTFAPIRLREGVSDRVMAVMYEVTEQVEARRRLEESERRFRQLVEQVKDYAIFRTDDRGRALTWNEGVRRVLGFDEAEFIGSEAAAIFTPEDVAAGVPKREFETAAREGSANDDRWMRRKSGERFAATGVTTALRGDHGELSGFTKVLRDDTDRVRAEETAAYLAAIVTSSDDAIISTDLSGRLTSWNKGAEQLYGYTAEEALGQALEVLIPPERAQEEPQILARIERGETVAHYETVRRRKDGGLIDVSLTVSPVQDKRGRLIGLAKIARDITLRKRLDQTVRESEARFRAIFEGAEVSIWEQDFSEVKRFAQDLQRQHGPGQLRAFLEAHPEAVDEAVGLIRIRDMNPATLRLFEAPNKEALLSSLKDLVLPDTQAVWREEIIALVEERQFYSAEVAVKTLAGRRKDLLLSMNIPPSAPERVLATLTDISAQKLAEAEREARAAEMERAVRFSEMFIGILGHDLRNPLSAITMAASVLEKNGDNPKFAKPVSRIHSSASRMERMISQLLDFTRVRLGRGIPLEPSSVELAEVCRAVIGELETGAGCHVQLEQTGDTHGTWDRDRLAQLVSNLVANACHHGAPGRPVRARLDGSSPERVRIEVRNEGAIPRELLPVLFEPLRYNEAAKRRHQSSGLGLGLYITQQIVLAHGGEIRVESDETNGTCFSVDLPRAPPAAADRVFA